MFFGNIMERLLFELVADLDFAIRGRREREREPPFMQ
jgi:hypothetical protein